MLSSTEIMRCSLDIKMVLKQELVMDKWPDEW